MKDISKLLANQGLVTSQGGYELADNFFAQFGDEDTAFVAYHSAPAGFEAFSVIFGDSVPMRMVLKAENALRIEAGAEMVTRRQMDGRMVMYFTAPLYPKIGAVIIGEGSSPSPDDFWGLKLKMPEGGTVNLLKNGSPNAVSLEVSTDGTNWQPWEMVGSKYKYTLDAGQTLCIRNTSETAVALSLSSTDRWVFDFSSSVYASGELTSLLCRENTKISIASFPYCFYGIFMQTSIKTMPSLFNISAMGERCFQSAFENCQHLEETTPIPNVTQASNVFRNCFSSCTSLKKVILEADVISGYYYLGNWLSGVAPAGDFYCPAELTIPIGASGIPSGWTRHDI